MNFEKSDNYKAVPVAAAREIAEKYDKDQVLIFAWESRGGLTHVTTYGSTKRFALMAAEGGDRVSNLLGLGRDRVFENYLDDEEYQSNKAKEADPERIITDREKQDLLERALPDFVSQAKDPVRFELDKFLVVGLIGQLHLAFRYPANVGETRKMVETFVRDLIEKLDPAHGKLYEVLMLGFNEKYDL